MDPRKAGSVEAALRRALKAAVASDWPTAETWLERIVEADSADLDAYHALARLYREQGTIGRALRMHQNLLLRGDLDQNQRNEALLELARDFDVGGFGERAAAGYEAVRDVLPRHQESLTRLVALLHGLREFPRALALIRRLRRLDRETADTAEIEILLSQAQAQTEEGNPEAARTSLKRCLRRDKTCGSAWAMLGELEVERGKDAKALDAWRRGALADPKAAADLYPKLAAGYSARGKPQDFEKLLRGILEDRPGDHAARIALARVLSGRGETSQAIEELSRAVEVAPTDTGLRIELGRQLLEGASETEALKAYASLLDALDYALTPAIGGSSSNASGHPSENALDHHSGRGIEGTAGAGETAD